MAHGPGKKILRHGMVTVVLTVLIVVAVILANASVTALAMRYGWYLNMNPDLYYPVTDTCYTYLDTYVMSEGTEDIRLIFCDEEEAFREDTTLSYVLHTAELLAARYPRAKIEYLNIWERPSLARAYGVTSATSVVVASGDEHRGCSLRDFFVFPVDDSENPVAYNGEKRFAVAMKAVVSADAPMAYLTLNHGETTPDYALMYALTDAGYMVTYLDALNFDIPDDCALLVTYNPTRDFTHTDGVSGVSEIDKLSAYLARGGKMMTFVSADTFAAGGFPQLEGFLREWGVTFEHQKNAEGIEECYAIRDTAHALTTDGYTIVGKIPETGKGSTVMVDIDGSLRVSNTTAIAVAEGYTAAGGNYTRGTRTLSPLLMSYPGAEAWAGGRAKERTDVGYNLITLTQDSATDASVFVCASTEFATEDGLQSGVYDNGAFLLTAMQAMGKDEIPIRLISQPISDDTIHTLTTVAARNITIALVAGPVLVVTVIGLVVLVRRKRA